MISRLVEELANSRDKFAFVLNSPEVHRLASDGELVRQLRQDGLAALETIVERSTFELGLIHVSRRFSPVSAAEFLHVIGSIESGVANSEDALLRARLTRAAILFTIQGDDIAA